MDSKEFVGTLTGRSEDEIEQILIKKFGEVPDWWLDPEERAKLLQGGITEAVIGAHLSGNFRQAYEGRLGKLAVGVGYRRNVEGQRLPKAAEENLVTQLRKSK